MDNLAFQVAKLATQWYKEADVFLNAAEDHYKHQDQPYGDQYTTMAETILVCAACLLEIVGMSKEQAATIAAGVDMEEKLQSMGFRVREHPTLGKQMTDITNKLFTRKDFEDWVEEFGKECAQSLDAETVVPDFMKEQPFMKKLWNAGCWLNDMLKKMGADAQIIKEIGFAHGQRSFGNDPVTVAIAYLNKYREKSSIDEKPGPELAQKIMTEITKAEEK